MCLATAYLNKKDETGVVAKNISNVRVEDGSVILTDILGSEIVIEGCLKSADLVNGVVEITTS